MFLYIFFIPHSFMLTLPYLFISLSILPSPSLLKPCSTIRENIAESFQIENRNITKSRKLLVSTYLKEMVKFIHKIFTMIFITILLTIIQIGDHCNCPPENT